MKLPHLNENGLIAGKIPKGCSCPFLDSCGLKSASCPSPGNEKKTELDCPHARGHSLLLIIESPILQSIIGK